MPDEFDQTDFKAVYDQPQSVFIQGQTRIAIPTGTGRVVLIDDWVQVPLYINFGSSTVAANPNSTRMDNGRAQYIIPDTATHMALMVQGNQRGVVVQFGLAER